MAGNEKEGYYCSICGGIPPDKISTRKVVIDGKETGIDHLEFIFGEVRALHLADEAAIPGEIMKRVKEFNYVPTKKETQYAKALLAEYSRWESGL